MPMRFPAVSRRLLVSLLLAVSTCAAVLGAPARAQLGSATGVPAPESLVHVRATPITIAAGGAATATIELSVQEGWHINANPPMPDYMIATKVAITQGHGVTPGTPRYPGPQNLKVEFDPNPLAVYTGRAIVTLPLTAAADAVSGHHTLRGKLTYQACNDQLCTPPVTLPFTLEVTVTGGVAAAAIESAEVVKAAPPDVTQRDTTAAPAAGSGFTTAPPPGGSAALENPVARALSHGGWRGFLTLLLVGLALNLTPCVYPMLGVTVSLFGAQKTRSPLASFSMAVVYVLGMAAMYSALGVVAALSGGLFGSALQSPVVSVGIGVLLVALALSMFGLYQLQPPAWLLTRLGGTTATSMAGAFLSGVVVGVFAAPCIGPPVVALLAVVGSKGDPWFGFQSFFTLSMGLGLPYLVLGTFSGLLRKMPRSGEWMIWVERLFGVILLAVGLFYALLAIAPSLAAWVLPVALVAGGIYLGFVEKSVGRWPGFAWLKRAVGVGGVAGGVVMALGLARAGVTFEAYSAPAVEAAVAEGRPVMLDFSADWCIPCRELEHVTFKHPRVVGEARRFRTFRVDLTRFDSPEVEELRKRWAINGVPTIVFLDPAGREVRDARVEGFMPPESFLERMGTVGKSGS